MSAYVEWFRYQLKASADGFGWAFAQIPASRQNQLPPDPPYMGSWTAARHVWHVTEYERCLALPAMLEWLGVPLPDDLEWPDDDNAWNLAQEQGLDGLIAEFWRVRQQQLDLLERLTVVDWEAPRETLWGVKPLAMVVTKTFQHTYEHGDTLLRMGLWWDTVLDEVAKKSAQGNQE
jgi:hypothetical protein